MLHSLLKSWPLFFGFTLIMIGNGLLVFMLGVRASQAGFSATLSSLMMSGYYLGFFGGSQIVPNILSKVGHIRTFGALSAITSAAVLVHLIEADAILWTVMRMFTGFGYAGMYIVVESWLNEQSTNKTRGQMLAIYMIITMGALSLGQLVGGFDDGTSIHLFLIASILVSIAVVPILISVAPAPDFSAPESVSMRRLYDLSPLAMVGMWIQGMTAAMTFAVGAIYATAIGLSPKQSALFVASVTLANMIIQYPVGRLSDILDRRMVILSVAIVASIAAFAASLYGPENYWLLILCTALYGGFSMTIYSLCISHANDYLTPNQMVSMASTMIAVNGLGAIIGPSFIGVMMDIFGSFIFFIVIGLIHIFLVGFTLYRMSVKPAVPAEAQGPFVAVPEMGTAVAASLHPEAAWVDDGQSQDSPPDPFENNPYLNLPKPSSSD